MLPGATWTIVRVHHHEAGADLRLCLRVAGSRGDESTSQEVIASGETRLTSADHHY